MKSGKSIVGAPAFCSILQDCCSTRAGWACVLPQEDAQFAICRSSDVRSAGRRTKGRPQEKMGKVPPERNSLQTNDPGVAGVVAIRANSCPGVPGRMQNDHHKKKKRERVEPGVEALNLVILKHFGLTGRSLRSSHIRHAFASPSRAQCRGPRQKSGTTQTHFIIRRQTQRTRKTHSGRLLVVPSPGFKILCPPFSCNPAHLHSDFENFVVICTRFSFGWIFSLCHETPICA